MLTPLIEKAKQPKDNKIFKLNSNTRIVIRRVGGQVEIEQTEKSPRPNKRISLRGVRVRDSAQTRKSTKRASFDEANIASTYKQSEEKDYTLKRITSGHTPYPTRVNPYPQLLRAQLKDILEESSDSFILDTSSLSNDSPYTTSSKEFVLKRQKFCKGEYTIAKCGHNARFVAYNSSHPPLGSVSAARFSSAASTTDQKNLHLHI